MSNFVVYLTGAETEADVTTANISNTLSGTTAASITDTWNTVSSQAGTPDVTIEIDWSKHNFMDYMQLRWDPDDEDAIENADTDDGVEHKVEYIINKGYNTSSTAPNTSRGFFDYGYSSSANVNPVTQGLNTLALDTSTLNNSGLITALKNTHSVNDDGVTDAERSPLLVYLTNLATEIFGTAGTLELISNEKTIADEVTTGGSKIATKLNNLINDQNANPLSPNYIVGKLLTGIIGQHLGSALYNRFQNHIEVYKMSNGVFTKYDPKLGDGRYYDVISEYNGTADASGNLVKADDLPHGLFNFGFRVGDTIRIRLNLVTDDNNNVVFTAVDSNGDEVDRIHSKQLYEFKINLIDDILELNSGSSDIAKTTNEDINTTGTIAVRYRRTPDLDLLGSGANENDSKLYSFAISSQPTNGTASINNQGVWTYSPNANYNSNVAATDSFTVLVKDKYGGQLASPLAGHTVSQVVTMTVTPVNDAPVANALSGLEVNEDNSLAIQLTSSDIDNSVAGGDEGQTHIYSIVQNGSIGNAVITNSATGAVTYTPHDNKYGTDSFTFKVTDSQGGVSNTASVSLTVISKNDRPIASAQSLEVDEDSPGLEIQLGGADVDNSVMSAGQAFTYQLVPDEGPENGTIVTFDASAGVVTYKPNHNYFGSDSFAFTITDDAEGSADPNLTSLPATINITVNSINDVPIATPKTGPQTVAVTEDTSKLIELGGTDVANEGQSLSFIIVTQPSNGSLTEDNNFSSNGKVIYTPSAHYYGSDSFTFRVHDGVANSLPATVSLSVSSVNDKPVANAKSVDVTEDVAKLIELGGSDVDNSVMSAGQTLTFAIASQPQNGSLTEDNNFSSNGKVTYTPDPNYNGADSFTFTITDNAAGASGPGLTSAAATISLSISAENDAPIAAADQSDTVDEDGTLSITLDAASDVDISRGENQTLTYSIFSNPSNGTLDITDIANRNISYTPNQDFNGSDSFVYQVSDGDLTDTATVTIEVTKVNDSPVAADDQTIEINEDNDGNGPYSFTLNAASDVDNSVSNEGQALSYEVIGTIPATSGILDTSKLANRILTFTPADNFNGQVQFTYRVSDDQSPALSDTGVITINVAAVNDSPVAAADQSFSIFEDNSGNGALSITLNAASDVDVDRGEQTLSYSISVQPTNGTLNTDGLANNGRVVTYTPNDDYHGSDSFTYEVSDGNGGTDTAVVNILIASVNDAPVAPNFTTDDTNEDTAITFNLPAAQDVDNSVMNEGQTFTYQLVQGQGTSNGSLVENDNFSSNGSLTYTPNANFNGTDSFKYTVTDISGSVSASGTGTINVKSVDDPPVTQNASYSTDEDTNLLIQLSTTSSDVEGDSLTYSIPSGTTTSNGTLIKDQNFSTNGRVTYKPNNNYNSNGNPATDTFTYKVTANGVDSNTSTITITVDPVNDAPVSAGNINLPASDEDVTREITVSAASDVDISRGENQTLVYSVHTNVATSAGNVALKNDTERTFIYTPADNFSGDVDFTYQVTDGNGGSDTATVSWTVRAVNDAPVATSQTGLQTVPVTEDTAKSISLGATDVEGSSLTYSIVTDPNNGSLGAVSALGVVTYTPAPNYNGTDSFEFKVNDGTVDSNTATVSINISAVNDAPVSAGNINLPASDEDVTREITVTAASDVDVTDSLTYSYVPNSLTNSEGKNPGSVALKSGTDRTFIYTPAANFSGDVQFTYQVTDGNGGSDTATVSWNVRAVNDAPVALAQGPVLVDEDTPKLISLGATDVEGSSLTYSIGNQPSNGSLGEVSASGEVTYTPAPDYNGTDSFTFTVNDGTVDSNEATVSISVTGVNDAPQFQSADNLTASTLEDQDVLIKLNTGVAIATDVDGDSLTYSIVTDPTNGSLNVANLNSSDNNGPRVTYTPNDNYNGSDSFVFRVSDGQNPPLSADKTVAITITAQPDDPTEEPTATTKTSGDAASGKYLVGETYQIDTSAISDVDTSDALTFSYSTTFQKLNELDQWVTDTDIDPITSSSIDLLSAHEFRRLVTVVTQTNGGDKSWTLGPSPRVLDETQLVQDDGTSPIQGDQDDIFSDVTLSNSSLYLQNGFGNLSLANANLTLVSNNTGLINLTDSTTPTDLQFLPYLVTGANGATSISVGIKVDNVLRKTLTYDVSIAAAASSSAFTISTSISSSGEINLNFDTSSIMDTLDNDNAYQYYINVYDAQGNQLNPFNQVVSEGTSSSGFMTPFSTYFDTTTNQPEPFPSGGSVDIFATLLLDIGFYVGEDGSYLDDFNTSVTTNIVNTTVNIN